MKSYCPNCGQTVGKHDHSDSDSSNAQNKKPADDGGPSLPSSVPPGALNIKESDVESAAVSPVLSEDDSTPSVIDSSTEPPKKRQRVMPHELRFHAQRLVVRQKMLRQIPGITKTHAEAIVAVYPTVNGLLGASIIELAKVEVGKSTLGQELATAVKRVVQ